MIRKLFFLMNDYLFLTPAEIFSPTPPVNDPFLFRLIGEKPFRLRDWCFLL